MGIYTPASFLSSSSGLAPVHGYVPLDPRSFQEAAPILSENRTQTRMHVGRGSLIAT